MYPKIYKGGEIIYNELQFSNNLFKYNNLLKFECDDNYIINIGDKINFNNYQTLTIWNIHKIYKKDREHNIYYAFSDLYKFNNYHSNIARQYNEGFPISKLIKDYYDISLTDRSGASAYYSNKIIIDIAKDLKPLIEEFKLIHGLTLTAEGGNIILDNLIHGRGVIKTLDDYNELEIIQNKIEPPLIAHDDKFKIFKFDNTSSSNAYIYAFMSKFNQFKISRTEFSNIKNNIENKLKLEKYQIQIEINYEDFNKFKVGENYQINFKNVKGLFKLIDIKLSINDKKNELDLLLSRL